MSRRPSLPGAAELFRATGGAAEPQPALPSERLRRVRTNRDEPDENDRGASVTPLSTPASSTSAVTDALAASAPVHRDPVPDLSYPARREPVADLEPEAGRSLSPYARPAPAAARPTSRVRQTRRQRIRSTAERAPSGRERHEEKITVYCSAEELFDLESARLVLRGEHGLVVDRGRIVREAVAVVLADLEAKGEDSIIVRRLRES